MNEDMTKAILDGRKTQTRRVVVVKDKNVEYEVLVKNNIVFGLFDDGARIKKFNQPIKDFIKQEAKYQKDEVIWVIEPVKIDMCFAEEIHFHYLADNKTSKLSIPKRFIKDGFAPDWMAHCNGVPNGCIKEMTRIFLKITDVRVERLQDISIEDCYSEGICPYDVMEMLDGTEFKEFVVFEHLWNKTAPTGYKWEDNPYVFVYEFERVNSDGSEMCK